MRRRWKNGMVVATAMALICALSALSATAWGDESDRPEQEDAAVAERTVEEGAQEEGKSQGGDGIDQSEGEEEAGGGAGRELPEEETEVTGGTLVIVTYLILWLMLGLFLLVTTRRQAKLQDDVESLENRIDELLGQ